MNLVRLIKSRSLGELQKYMSPEEFSYYNDAFNQCNGYMHLTENVYCKMYADQYTNYREFQDYMTLNGRMNRIKVPLFAFGAVDDIILSHITIPKDEVRGLSNPVCLATSKHGAHCCHIAGLIRPKCWYQVPCAEFLLWLDNRLSKEKAD